jgi:hypothetical protein
MSKSEPTLSSGPVNKSRRAKSKAAGVQRVDAPHSLSSNASESVGSPISTPVGVPASGALPLGASEHVCTDASVVSVLTAEPARAAEPIRVAASPQQPSRPLASPASDVGQLQLQAEQISAYLVQRQKELDHREAELNSRAAQLESDTRAVRLWLAERESDISSRVQKIAEQEQQLAHQQPTGQQQLRELHRDSTAGEAHAANASASADSAGIRDEASASQADAVQVDALEMRRRQLDEAESRITLAQADIDRIQGQLLAERRMFHEEMVVARRQLADVQCEAEAELEQKRQAVQRRSEHIDHCRMALEQLRSELERTQRETLELRLATEELWVQLSGATPPAAVTRSLGRIRSRLADNYRQANADLDERKMELEATRVELAEQCKAMTEQKKRFEQWLASLQEQVEEQATRLVAREEQLRGEEVRLREESQGWRSERMKYQQEIRRLRAELALREGAGVAS